jgi:hypothetical protein
MGRPPKKPDDVKTSRLEVRMTAAEFALVEAAADGKLATWAREALIRAARRVKGSGKRGN